MSYYISEETERKKRKKERVRKYVQRILMGTLIIAAHTLDT